MTAEALGLTWHPQWASDGEGPHTLVAKLAAANPMAPDRLRKLVLNTHAVSPPYGSAHAASFLSGRWMRRGADICAWSRALTHTTLDKVLGDWTFRLASDKSLRYCPSCLGDGFQSPLCQITALSNCPVHGDALRNTCSHCGAAAPPYAWDRSLEAPMTCVRCRLLLSNAWSTYSSLRWKAMPGAHTYRKLADQMLVLQASHWTDPAGWHARFARSKDPDEARRAEGALLMDVLRIGAPNLQSKIWASAPASMTLPLDKTRAAVAISDEMVRLYHRKCDAVAPRQQQARMAAQQSVECFLTLRNRAFKLEDFKDAPTFAYVLFRRRFEESSKTRGRVLSSRFLSDGMQGVISAFARDLDAWARFLDWCYQAEVQYCELLHERTHGMTPGEPAWQEMINLHSAALSPLMLPLPFGIGVLQLNLEERRYAVIVMADPARASEFE